MKTAILTFYRRVVVLKQHVYIINVSRAILLFYTIAYVIVRPGQPDTLCSALTSYLFRLNVSLIHLSRLYGTLGILNMAARQNAFANS